MILYHGTNMAFDVIDLKKSKPNKDFGRGFYLSADYDQALAMAKVKVDQLEERQTLLSSIRKSMQVSAVQVRCSLGRISCATTRKQALQQVEMLEQAKQTQLAQRIGR